MSDEDAPASAHLGAVDANIRSTDVPAVLEPALAPPSNLKVISAQRRLLTEKAMDLRLSGASVPQIAKALDSTPFQIESLLKRSLLRSAEKSNVTAMRELEEQRLDALLLSWAQRSRTDPRAADIVLRISERRSRLAGLDMPMRVDIATVIAQIAANEGWDLDNTINDVRQLARDQKLVSLEADDAETNPATPPTDTDTPAEA